VSTDARRVLGRAGEQQAAEHLARLGFDVLERNFRTRWGELDLIAFDGATLVFVEVKTRRLGNGQASVFDALHERKRGQVRKMAGMWLCERPDRPYAEVVRFDAIGVSFDAAGRLVSLEHLEGAF
jgi:putative endonuclease